MITAFIPVRGNSRSIPDKNIRIVGGKPLLYWVAKAACECSGIDEVYISTDSKRIGDVAKGLHLAKLRVIDRPWYTATDTASTETALIDFATSHPCDAIILIQATSPLLTSEDLAAGLEMYRQDEYDSVLSVVRQKRFIWSKNENGAGVPVNYSPEHRPMRQSFDGFFVENGAFYCTSRERLLREGVRISGNIGLLEMPPESYTEVDEPVDMLIADTLLSDRKARTVGRFENIRMFVTDCDGCMTDGGMYYSASGEAFKKFDTRDGMGLELLRTNEIRTCIITGEELPIANSRAEKLHADAVICGAKDKLSALNGLCSRFGIALEEVAYLGDDINDLPCIIAAGVGCCVADAHSTVKKASSYITSSLGGHGAIREIADMIMVAKQG